MPTPLHTVHVRVNDAATGQPTPVRIRFTGPDGTYYAPFGRLTEFAVGQGEFVGGNVFLNSKRYAYIDGTCEIRLPSGQVFVEVHKGPEYISLNDEIMLSPGQLAVRLEIERWSDLRKEGWYPGDTQAHFIDPHAALLEAAAEDLAVVNLLAVELQIPVREKKEKVRIIPNLLAFSGQFPALERSGHIVVVNTYNHHPSLGDLSLLNCHRVVYPLTFGGPDRFDDWALADWCDQCRRKGGLVVWPPIESKGKATLYRGEPPADVVLGKIDALELNRSLDINPEILRPWYGFLNLGFRLPLAGGSGKASNRVALGSWRTYARLQPGEEFTYQNWIEAVRAGRTFATKGPLMSFAVQGQDPGATIDSPSQGQTVQVHAEVYQAFPPNRLEIICNGEVVARAEGAELPPSIDKEIAIPAGGWLAAAYWGHEDPKSGIKLLAHSSPVYVQVEGQRRPDDQETKKALVAHFDKMLEWVDSQGRFENERQRDHLAGIFKSAREILLEGKN
jgi:hypothetical protein